MRKLITATILTCSTSITSFAQPVEKDGLPCVQELCIGDGIAELKAINWVKAQRGVSFATDRTPKKPEFAEYSENPLPKDFNWARTYETFKGDVKDIRNAGRYIAGGFGTFDSASLPLIEKVQIACRYNELTGRFNSASGHPTIVTIGLIPSSDGTSHRWRVTTIKRMFPEGMTREQQLSIDKMFYTTYSAFNIGLGTKAYAKLDMYSSGMLLYWWAVKADHEGQRELYMKNPLCGGVKGTVQLN